MAKIFVGGLSWETSDNDLRQYFESYGTVEDCTVKTDPETGKSRGFGFITFSDSSSIDAVLKEPQGHHLHGRKIDPKPAKAREGGPGGGGGGRASIPKVHFMFTR